MTTNEKIKLITRNCQEVLVEEELRDLIESGTELIHYIGFEISGLVHLGTGLMSMGKVADFLKAGVKCQIFLADFHTYLNNKLGGKWEDIRWASENYFKQAMVASLLCFGVDVEEEEKNGNLKFVFGKELYSNNIVHWETFMEVGKHMTLSRNLRSVSIMGKKQGMDVDMATLFYPPLQVADIFTMKVNLAHAGMDQRKAHVVARTVAKKITVNPLKNKKGEVIAPVAIHHKLIAGLTGPGKDGNDEESPKMSKSKPNSAIFVHDSPDEIVDKIKKAYGPPKQVEFNPLLNWVETLVFWGEEEIEPGFEIIRPEKFGGNVTYKRMDKIVGDYVKGDLFPLDLKNSLATWLIEKLKPARDYFEKDENKQGLVRMKALMGLK